MYPVIAQAVGIIAMLFNIFSYQQKSAKRIIALQFFGASFFVLNYLMLGAYIAAILNAVGVIRAVLFLKKEKTKVDKLSWVAIFGIAYVGAYVLNFTLMGKDPTVENLLVEILPVIGMFATHLAYRYDSPKTLRAFCLISSVSWLIFNIVNFAIGAILCEVFSLASIAIATLRERKKEKA